MFEMLPGIREYGSRRPVPMGDGGGRLFVGDRDKALAAIKEVAWTPSWGMERIHGMV